MRKTSTLYTLEYVALQRFAKMQEGRNDVAKLFSDTVLLTFDKTKVPCPSSIEDK